MKLSRPALLAGIAGPAAFIGAWATGSVIKDGYSPISDAISRLAEQGASTQPLMTAGFIGFGIVTPFYARELGRAFDSRGLQAAVTATGVGTLAVAAFPLSVAGGTGIDRAHEVAAGSAYLANVAAVLIASRYFEDRRVKVGSWLLGAAMAGSLVASLQFDDYTGVLQRSGLTMYDAWSIALAVHLLRTRGSASSDAPGS